MAIRKLKTPAPTDSQAIERYKLLDKAVRKFSGNLDELESAVGMFVLGHHVGWKILHMIHTKKTIRKYEEILGIKIAETFDPFGPDAERANAYRALMAVTNFWKVVSGDEKIDLDRDERRSLT